MRTKTIEATLKARIAKGVKFLNKEYGRSWVRRVDDEALALASGSACLLGQLEGDYSEALGVLGLDSHKAERLGLTDLKGGFWDMLDQLWQSKIQSLRRK